MLNVYQAFTANGCTKEFCGQHHIMYRNLKRVVEIRNQLASLMTHQFKLKLTSCGTDTVEIRRAITSGLFPFAAYLHHSGSYRMVRGDAEVSLHPMSCLFTEKQPTWIVVGEVLHTTKLFVKDVTVIDSRWLLELAPHYYHNSAVKD